MPFQRVLGGKDDWVRKFIKRYNRPEPGRSYVNEMIHQSALDRFDKEAPVQDGDKRSDELYRPKNLEAARGALPVVGHDGEVADAPG